MGIRGVAHIKQYRTVRSDDALSDPGGSTRAHSRELDERLRSVRRGDGLPGRVFSGVNGEAPLAKPPSSEAVS